MEDAALFSRLGIFVIPDFLDDFTCNELIAGAHSLEVTEAKVTGTEGSRVDAAIRSTLCTRLPDDINAELEERVNRLKERLQDHFDLQLSKCERIQLLRYQTGDFFRVHADQVPSGDPKQTTHERKISVVLFLNHQSPEVSPGTFCGGALVLYGLLGGDTRVQGIGFPLSPRRGMLVAFPSTMRHEVEPITVGERFTAVTWFA